MTYQVLARKWRPQTFADVVGQEHVVRTIQRAIDTDRLAHAFLFTGSRGVGKTTMARILAKSLSCETGISLSPCGKCHHCVEITEGRSVDVLEIDGASNNGVDNIRELRESAQYKPQSARFRIFIVDEVHMLSTGAFNALLKILEEPPPHVKFIFATTEVHKVPVTILSRCQRYDFKRLPTQSIAAHLRRILASEGIPITEDGIDLISRVAEGGMRDALSLTDQVLSFAGAGATADDVADAIGFVGRRTIAEATKAAIRCDAKGALHTIYNAFLRGHDLKQLLDGVAAEIRHLAVSKATGSIRGFADLSDDEINAIDEHAKQCDARDLQRLLHMALDGIESLGRSENLRMTVELIFLRMCQRPPLGEALAISEAIVRLKNLVDGQPVPPVRFDPRMLQQPSPVAIAQDALRGGSQDISRGAHAPAVSAPVVAPIVSTPNTAPAATTARPATSPRAPSSPHSPAPAAPADADDGEDEPEGDDFAPTPAPVQPRSSVTHPASTITSAPTSPRTSPQTSAPARPTPAKNNEIRDEEEELEEDPTHDPALDLPLQGIDSRWLAFFRMVSKRAPMTAARFELARVTEIRDETEGEISLILAFDSRFDEESARESLREPQAMRELAEAFGKSVQPRTVPSNTIVGAADIPTIAQARAIAVAAAQKALEVHAQQHPAVAKVLQIFGGVVRSVKRSEEI